MRRQTVGAHYGLTDWLAQRVTAIVMTLYVLMLLAVALWNGGLDYSLWRALFGNGAFKVATFLFMAALLYHAWIGVRDIWMDYIKATAVRLALEVLTVVVLVAYVGWVLLILWGRTA